MLPEIQAAIDARPELRTAGPDLILEKLNSPGTAIMEGWTVSPVPVGISWQFIISLLSLESIGKLHDAIKNPVNDLFKTLDLYYACPNKIDVTYPTTISLINALMTAEIITADERDAIIRLGEIKKSFAQGLLGRPMKKEDLY